MIKSFAQFHGLLCAGITLLALLAMNTQALAQTGVAEVDAAQQAVVKAEQAFADQYAPEAIALARQSLVQAQAAASNRRQRRNAPALGLRALAEADLAVARSEEAVAQAELQQQQAEIRELQRTLQLETQP